MSVLVIDAIDDLGLDRSSALSALSSGEGRLAIVKMLLGIEGIEQDALVNFAISVVEERILAYIGHDTIPGGLENALMLMVVSYYKGAGLGEEGMAHGGLKSVRRGDATLSYAGAVGPSATAQTFDLGAGADGIYGLKRTHGSFFGWRSLLDSYRRLRW